MLLDRIGWVLMSISWEEKHPLCTLTTLTRIGSDHCPLLVDTMEAETRRQRHFFLRKAMVTIGWVQLKGGGKMG